MICLNIKMKLFLNVIENIYIKMKSYVVYGTIESSNSSMIDYEWMRRSFEYVDVFYNENIENIGIIYGIKCLLDNKNGTVGFHPAQKKSLEEFMIVYKEQIPDATCGYFTGIVVEDIDCLGYLIYDLEQDEDDEDE